MPIFSFQSFKPSVDPTAFIAPNACIIGNVSIAEKSSVWFSCVLRGDINFISVGKNTNIQDGTIVHVDGEKYPTIIGDKTTIGHQCLLHGCNIGSNSFIGMGSIIMDGVVVEEYSMVAAGSLVTRGKIIKTGEIWAGRPAKPFRSFSKKDIEKMKENANNYVVLGRKYSNY